MPVPEDPPAASAAGTFGEGAFSTTTLTLVGLAMGGGIGWLVRRRARLARREAPARSLRSRKRLVKVLLKVRVGAGLVAILAGIAVLVFWAIEEIDGATKEPGLYLALLGLALATGIGAWWCGRLADRLHRALYD